MIFVTVGTHEQPFNRLIECMDKWAKCHDEKVIMQIGYSTYIPEYATYKKLFSYQEMNRLINEARLIITHGGPSSFISSLEIGKKPIVIPRKKEFSEHVNNHQLKFCLEVEKRLKNIIVVENIDDLFDEIENYKECEIANQSNNAAFCEKLQKIVKEMF